MMQDPELARLFRTGDDSKSATGYRMRVIRFLTDDTIAQRATKLGTSQNNLQSIEKGQSAPAIRFMTWCMAHTPADVNFIAAGDYSKLTYEATALLAEAARKVQTGKKSRSS